MEVIPFYFLNFSILAPKPKLNDITSDGAEFTLVNKEFLTNGNRTRLALCTNFFHATTLVHVRCTFSIELLFMATSIYMRY